MFAKTEVVTKALSLIQKLQHKYGFKPKFYEITPDNVESDTPESNSPQLYTAEPLERERLLPTISEEPENQDQEPPDLDDREDGEWCLVNHDGYKFTLPKTMIFLGREECDVEVQCESVDKRHAVVTFDHYLRRFKVKDLSTANGTFVNSTRIPEQEYFTLEHQDCLQLGHGYKDNCKVLDQFKIRPVPTMYTAELAALDSAMMYQVEHIEERPIAESTDHLLSPSDSDLPSWASPKEDESPLSPMAECKPREPVAYFFDLPTSSPTEPQATSLGCIVEQTIEHTCGESIPESETARHDLDRSYSHDSIVMFSLGCNTWPKKRFKQPKKHVKELFDIMNSEESSTVEGLIDPNQGRVLRGKGAPMNILPAELETVKKGTPLYGQPEWWGEEETDLNIGKFRSNGSMDNTPGTLTSPDKDRVKSLGDERNAVSNVSSDHEIKQNGVHDCEHVPMEETTLARKSATPEGHSMAFTVDFGDEDSKKSVEGRSLSDFVPSKIRKSFRERKEKSAEKAEVKAVKAEVKAAKAVEKAAEASHNTPPKSQGRAVSEGRDISPTRQCKIDDIWNSSTSSKDSSGNRRSNMMRKSAISRSVDLEDSHTDSPSARANKTSVKRRPPISQTLTKPKSVIRARKTQSQVIQPTQLNDSTSYLMDKMFQNSTGSVDNLKSKDCDSSITEYDMYSESRQYDTQRSLKVSKELAKYESERSLKVTKELINKTSAKQLEEGAPAPLFKKSTDKSAKKESEKENEIDKVSESGTYTIEEEKDSKEEDEARKNIDQVFGVVELPDGTSMDYANGAGQVNGEKGDNLEATLKTINSELEEIEKLEKLRAQKPPADSLDVEIGSVARDDLCDDGENPSSAVPSDAPKWVSQWAALTNQKGRKNSSGDMELSSPSSSISDDSRSAVKVNGIGRKRPGTGRKLPTIPPVTTSPAGSDGVIAKESPRSSKSDLTINGTSVTPRQRGVKISSHVSARYEDTETESISPTKTDSGSESVRDNDKSSTLSIASIDTEVLLKDTQTVMAAMEQRVGSRSKRDQEKSLNNGHVPFMIGSDINDDLGESINLSENVSLDASVDLDSDTSSTVALVNGDEEFVKPSYFKSPRESLTRAKLKLKSESLPSKPVIDMGGASSKNSNRKSIEGKSVVSDVFSDVNGDMSTRTNGSEVSTEASQFVRQGSKGKGQMSMTRPNRAFQLRRARADDEVETPKLSSTLSPKSASTLSIASSGFSSNRSAGSLSNISKAATTPQKPKRPMSGHFTPKQLDSARSQNSLGAQIVKKSRENQRENFQRADGGRHSLRVTRSMTLPNQTPSTASTSSTRSSRQSTTTPSSSNLKHSTSLRVTGMSAKERSSSVTRTKTESPRSAERNAWKRRKEYDPRRAVAEAKTKSKETSRRKHEIDLYNQRQVTRSASFTNTRDLNLKLSAYSQNDSISSADDLSRRSSATSDVFDDHSPKRGFVPYSGRSIISSNVSFNADEYEVDSHSRSSSTQEQHQYNRKTFYNNPHISAFTPPPRNQNQYQPKLSVFKPSPTPKKIPNSSIIVDKRVTVRGTVSFRRNPSAQSPRSNANRRQSADVFTPTNSLTNRRQSTDVINPTNSITSRRQSADVINPTNRLTNRRQSADTSSLTSGWRSVDSIGLYQSALSRKTPEEDHPKTVQIVQSYDTIIVSSVYQLSLKLKTSTDRILDKLRDKEMIENGADSSLDDIDNQSAVSEIPAYKSANQELAGVLKNLRKLEQHIKIMNKALFPDDHNSPDTSKEKHEYLQQIERIRNELAGFQPIETPRTDAWKQSAETVSVESDCEELSQADNYY